MRKEEADETIKKRPNWKEKRAKETDLPIEFCSGERERERIKCCAH